MLRSPILADTNQGFWEIQKGQVLFSLFKEGDSNLLKFSSIIGGVLVAALAFLAFAPAGFASQYERSIEELTIPDVVLVNQNGDRVRFKSLLECDKPVVVDFIYATCTTICPVLSAGFSAMQKKLGPDSQDVQLVSITIDPENDTPKVMKEYLKVEGNFNSKVAKYLKVILKMLKIIFSELKVLLSILKI